ncbi:MAG: hypothetical protein QOE19_2606 [Actinomycetota bacterium]|nr:hypothetical protein [Actinomycetota bacterium]
MKKTQLLSALAALVLAPLTLAACSHGPEAKAVDRTPRATPSSATPTPPPPLQPSLLSGRMGKADGPVYAVKIDNTAKAHPQVGVTKADVVYVEQVEGGVTRLAAVYSSEYPRLVGPVRSGRISDIELLSQYGTVGLIYSGSQDRLLPKLQRADLKLVSFDANPLGYTRVSGRPMPYDVIGTFSALRERAGEVSTPTRVGYTFGAAPLGGRPATDVSVRYPFARLDAAWSAAKQRWLLSMDGVPDRAAEGGQLGPTTLVVQYADVHPSPYHDVNGVNTPMTETVGQGKALIFRDGQVYDGTWSRTSARQPTSYTMAGVPAVFAPGQVWVALIGSDRRVTVK